MKRVSAGRLGILIAGLIFVTVVSCGPKVPSFSFAFLTDIHLLQEKGAVEGLNMALDKVEEYEPEFVLTGGDQVFDAYDQQFEAADRLYDLYLKNIERIAVPIFNTLGNHDIFGVGRESGVDPSHSEYGKNMFAKRQAENRYYSFDHKGWHFMVLDSVQLKGEGGYRGGIDADQMTWISEELENLERGTPIVISTHIPFISVSFQLREEPGEYRNSGLLVDNAFEVLGLFKGYNLRLVLQGHLHAYEDILFRGVRFITGGAVSASWWDGPLRGMEEGFLLVQIKGDAIDSQYIDYDWEAATE